MPDTTDYAGFVHTSETARTGLRAVTREAIRSQVALRAVELLDEQGFDNTTVEDLAAAVGISPRSFFRYFPTKEDVVIGNLMPMGRLVEKELLARPKSEAAWAALRESLSPMVLSTESDPVNVLRQARVASSTPGLRARTIERHEIWALFLAPVVARRRDDTSATAMLTAGALTHCALACLHIATNAWVSSEGRNPFTELLDIAFSSVHPFSRE